MVLQICSERACSELTAVLGCSHTPRVVRPGCGGPAWGPATEWGALLSVVLHSRPAPEPPCGAWAHGHNVTVQAGSEGSGPTALLPPWLAGLCDQDRLLLCREGGRTGSSEPVRGGAQRDCWALPSHVASSLELAGAHPWTWPSESRAVSDGAGGPSPGLQQRHPAQPPPPPHCALSGLLDPRLRGALPPGPAGTPQPVSETCPAL